MSFLSCGRTFLSNSFQDNKFQNKGFKIFSAFLLFLALFCFINFSIVNFSIADETCPCGNNDHGSCIGCDGVPWSGKVVDSCGVCGGNGSTCTTPTPTVTPGNSELPPTATPIVAPTVIPAPTSTPLRSVCTNTDVKSVLVGLDGGSQALQRLVRSGAKTLLQARNASANKRFSESIQKKSLAAHKTAWSSAWGIPQVATNCSLEVNCSSADLSHLKTSYIASVKQLRSLISQVASRLKTTKKASAVKFAKRISVEGDRLLAEVLKLAEGLPLKTTSCQG